MNVSDTAQGVSSVNVDKATKRVEMNRRQFLGVLSAAAIVLPLKESFAKQTVVQEKSTSAMIVTPEDAQVYNMVPRQPLTTIPKYDEMVTQQRKLLSNNMLPETNVIRTIRARVLEPWSFEPASSAGTSKSSSPGSGGAGG